MGVAELKQELTRLTNAERLQLLEAIWDSLEDKDEMESPEWHGKVLAERAAIAAPAPSTITARTEEKVSTT